MPLYGTAAIVRVGVRSVSSGTTRVLIPDISPAGLRFLSKLSFPENPAVILEINLRFDGAQYSLQGCVVRRDYSESGEFEYGFRFIEPDFQLREALKNAYSRVLTTQCRNIIIVRMK